MGTTSREAQNRELIRTAYAALNARETDAVMNFLSPNAICRFRPPGGREEVLRGPQKLIEFYEALFRIFDLVHIEHRELEAVGDTVRADGTVTLRLRGTGESTQANIRHTFTVRDGRIVSAIYDDPVNPLELMRAADDIRKAS